jgi:hypothetical protein
MINNVGLHLELLHAALTNRARIEMKRDGRWMVADEVTVKPSPYPRSDEIHYCLKGRGWLDYVALSESTDLLRIVRQ